MTDTRSHIIIALFAVSVTLCAGCATTQEVILAKAMPTRKIQTVAQVPDAGNSDQVNGYLEAALQREGISVKAPLSEGTRKSSEADAIIIYVDVWRWDLAMYLQSLRIRLYDADTGDLLVTGQWSNSRPFHGFHDAEAVVETVVTEMFAKLRAATR